jgi:hypothetical protein
MLTVDDIRATVNYLRSIRAIASPDLPAIDPIVARVSNNGKGDAASAAGKAVFEGACVSCHDWSGKCPISPRSAGEVSIVIARVR